MADNCGSLVTKKRYREGGRGKEKVLKWTAPDRDGL